VTRRDLCDLVGQRAAQLSDRQATAAWRSLARDMEQLGEKDVPKFRDVIRAIRAATIEGVNKP
jgi:hypothetical protein